MIKQYCREYLHKRDAGLLHSELHDVAIPGTGHGNYFGFGDGEGWPINDMGKGSGNADGSGDDSYTDHSDAYLREHTRRSLHQRLSQQFFWWS